MRLKKPEKLSGMKFDIDNLKKSGLLEEEVVIRKRFSNPIYKRFKHTRISLYNNTRSKSRSFNFKNI